MKLYKPAHGSNSCLGTLATLVAVAALAITGFGVTQAHAAPMNSPLGLGAVTAYSQEYPALTIRIATTGSNTGELVVQSNYKTTFTLDQATDELVAANGQCLFYRAAGYSSLGTCNASSAADVWGFGTSSNNYSEWYSGYQLTRGDCQWGPAANGLTVFNAPCNGSDGGDRWHWS